MKNTCKFYTVKHANVSIITGQTFGEQRCCPFDTQGNVLWEIKTPFFKGKKQAVESHVSRQLKTLSNKQKLLFKHANRTGIGQRRK